MAGAVEILDHGRQGQVIMIVGYLGPILLTWIIFDNSMDK